MTKRENFMEKVKDKNNHCSAMSNSAWCDLNGKVDTLKLHDPLKNPLCKCQKQITFIPRQFQFEGSGFRNIMKNFFEGTG